MSDELMARLIAPFDTSEVKFKPGTVSGNRALAMPYVDARVVQDRLDEVLGVVGWQDDFEALPDGSVICRLRLKIGEQWITKVDVGGPSEQPDGGDRMKAAFSDALKRAAVKFGIGRYLYRVPAQWVDWDPQKKRFAQPPRLAAPGGTPAPSKPARQPNGQKPAAAEPAAEKPRERPYDADQDPDQPIDAEMAGYLVWAFGQRGFGLPAIEAWIKKQPWRVEKVADLSVRHYREALEKLESFNKGSKKTATAK